MLYRPSALAAIAADGTGPGLVEAPSFEKMESLPMNRPLPAVAHRRELGTNDSPEKSRALTFVKDS